MKYLRHHAIASVEFLVAHQLEIFIEKVRARADADGLDDDHVEEVIAFAREHNETVALPEARKIVNELYDQMMDQR